MLRFDNVTLRQGDFQMQANFAVPVRAWVSVIGPSGGGKSTLLNAVAGFIAPAAGQITWDGYAMSANPGARPTSILFQDQNLFPHLTVLQNVGLGISPNLNLSDDHLRAIHVALEAVGLGDKSTAKPNELSGGQQSRAALARVLVRERPLILLDEPFAALGPALRVEMMALVRDIQMKQGATVLMVTHDKTDWAQGADHVVLVADGVAHAPVSTPDLLRNPPAALQAYLGT